jgi:integrase
MPCTIRQLVSGRYQVTLRVAGFHAERKTFDQAFSASRWAKDREASLALVTAQIPQAHEAMTLREALLRYRAEVTPQKKSYRQEMKRIDAWSRHPLATRQLREIRGAHLAQHKAIRLALGRAPNTIRLELAVISHVFEVARTDWGLEGLTNPRKALRRAPLGGTRDRRLMPGEYEALMGWCDASQNHIFKAMIILAVETAMRRGELLSLQWRYIDLAAQLAYLPDTKNGTARTVPLSRKAVSALETLGGEREGHVFRVHENWVTKRFITARTQCGLENIRFHDLRHEAVSRLFEKGFNMMEAATVSGHKTMQMLKRYTHLDPRSLLARLG